jgi:hypothetical protein
MKSLVSLIRLIVICTPCQICNSGFEILYLAKLNWGQIGLPKVELSVRSHVTLGATGNPRHRLRLQVLSRYLSGGRTWGKSQHIYHSGWPLDGGLKLKLPQYEAGLGSHTGAVGLQLVIVTNISSCFALFLQADAKAYTSVWLHHSYSATHSALYDPRS